MCVCVYIHVCNDLDDSYFGSLHSHNGLEVKRDF